MKIYFAGSIRGGRQDITLYQELIIRLRQYGSVLTEHVAEKDLREDDLSDEAIYGRDMEWLANADAVVAEVTVPSHGVGYEIARAETLHKPILCLYRPEAGSRLSALIAGSPATQCEAYRELNQLDPVLDAFFRRIAPRAASRMEEQGTD